MTAQNGVDELRKCVKWCSYCRESVNQQYTAEELLVLYRFVCSTGFEFGEFLDELPQDIIEKALRE